MNTTGGSTTMISDLSDVLMRRIFRGVPVNDCFQAKCVSKRWDSIIRERDSKEPIRVINLSGMFSNNNFQPKPELLNSVDEFLLKQANAQVNINAFYLSIPPSSSSTVDSSELAVHMNTWVECLTRCNIKHVSFDFSNHRFCFPRAILSAKTLTTLTLIGCKLDAAAYDDIMNLASLEVLRLVNVAISDKTIELLIKNCKSLHAMVLCMCRGITGLCLTGLPGLKVLAIQDNPDLRRVEIDEPSLVQLEYQKGFGHAIEFEFADCTALKFLKLDHFDERLSHKVSQLPGLEHMEICSPHEITSPLNISNKHLKTLSLLLCNLRCVSEVNINTPNLLVFITNALLPLLSLKAPPTLEIYLGLYPGPSPAASYVVELLKFLSNFDLERVTLWTNLDNSIVSQEWKTQFSQVDCLAPFQKLWVDPEARLVDALRSICPRVEQHEEGMLPLVTTSPSIDEDDLIIYDIYG